MSSRIRDRYKPVVADHPYRGSPISCVKAQKALEILATIPDFSFEGSDGLQKTPSQLKSQVMTHEFDYKKMGDRYAAGIAAQSPIDHVDKITLKDIQDVASKLIKTKPTIVSVGNQRSDSSLDVLDRREAIGHTHLAE